MFATVTFNCDVKLLFCALIDQFLFPKFKGFDARSLGPISYLVVPSCAIGIRHSVKGCCASGSFCYYSLRQRRIALPDQVILSHLYH